MEVAQNWKKFSAWTHLTRDFPVEPGRWRRVKRLAIMLSSPCQQTSMGAVVSAVGSRWKQIRDHGQKLSLGIQWVQTVGNSFRVAKSNRFRGVRTAAADGRDGC